LQDADGWIKTWYVGIKFGDEDGGGAIVFHSLLQVGSFKMICMMMIVPHSARL